jgi:hypothetical protein
MRKAGKKENQFQDSSFPAFLINISGNKKGEAA